MDNWEPEDDCAPYPNNTPEDTFAAIIYGGEVTLDSNIEIEMLTFSGHLSVEEDDSKNLVVKQNFIWNSGTHKGGGATTVHGGFILSSPYPKAFAADRILDLRGGASWSGSGIFTLGDGAGIINRTGSRFVIGGDQRMAEAGGGVNFYNDGEVTKTSGEGLAKIEPPFHNEGITTSQRGTLILAGGGQHSGAFTTSGDGLIEFRGHHKMVRSPDESNGHLIIATGLFEVDSAFTNRGGTTLTYGTITGKEDYTEEGTFKWISGYQQGTANPINANTITEGELVIMGSSRNLGRGEEHRSLRVTGGATWIVDEDNPSSSDSIWVSSGSEIINERESTFRIDRENAGIRKTTSISEAVFDNSGRFLNNEGSITINTKFNNWGQVDSYGGNVRLIGGGRHIGIFNTVEAEIELGGDHLMQTGENVTHAANFNISGTVLLIDEFRNSGGTTLTGTIKIAPDIMNYYDYIEEGSFTWISGRQSGPGGVTYFNGELIIQGGTKYLGEKDESGRTLDILANATWEATPGYTNDIIYVYDGSLIKNRHGSTFDIQQPGARIAVASGERGTTRFQNYGKLKISGEGERRIDIIFINERYSSEEYGEIEINDGTLFLVHPDGVKNKGYIKIQGGTLVAETVENLIGAADYSGLIYGDDGFIDADVVNKSDIFPSSNFDEPGTIWIEGDLTCPKEADSRPFLGITLLATEEYSKLVVGGTAELSGQLRVYKDSSFSPALHDRFTVLEAATILGKFDILRAQPALFGDGLTYSVHYDWHTPLANTVEIEVVEAPDFDDDGDVDADDVALFGSSFGQTSCTGQHCERDLDNDGDIDGTDLVEFVIRYQFSTSGT
jgi:hypothetical protein